MEPEHTTTRLIGITPLEGDPGPDVFVTVGCIPGRPQRNAPWQYIDDRAMTIIRLVIRIVGHPEAYIDACYEGPTLLHANIHPTPNAIVSAGLAKRLIYEWEHFVAARGHRQKGQLPLVNSALRDEILNLVDTWKSEGRKDAAMMAALNVRYPFSLYEHRWNKSTINRWRRERRNK